MNVFLKEIHKVFSDGTHALKGVSLDIRPGEVLALLGENGAGKTTLMKILAGIYKPTSGEIYIDGKKVRFKNAREAQKAGIAMVHQHFSLIPGLTAIENIAVAEGASLKYITRDVRERAEKIAAELGFEVDWDRDVEELPLGVRQRVEIVKALYLGANLLILDEPTTVLSPPEVKSLFQVVRRLKEQGKSVVYITHKIPEVVEIADRVAVLRRGVKVAEFTPPYEPKKLVEAMVGELKVESVARAGQPGERQVLEVRDLWVYEGERPVVQGVSLTVREREILAIVGVEGNGQEHLVDAIVGVRKYKGYVRIYGGYAYIPDDRHQKALLLERNLIENAVLGRESYFSKYGFILWKKAEGFTLKLVEEFGIVTPSPWAAVRQLSGGNQQKLVVARELARGARLIIAHQPTRGLDVATTEYVQRLLIKARNEGSGILLVTSDLDEAYKLADTIAVMYRGRIVALGPVEEMNIDTVGRKMAGL
ncbi:ribose ABC transport system ATP-binding [Pyrobaculum aerophilum str. IM2]|uniref:Ribose ABC transport system ATP-binding n=2 Tax=Pyrobaculum aerophilum TaxID=13773 RepID=Q8ZTS1_PYRAE|nr:ABC transporter ATP-binding protein [Pyrobaculum aerophilum]AAL64688.1 ribose ABC transport system ATP-binding [Pyrobaculum aerophilum str. IM2]HII46207.1 ABC transporter ATP-binding protein [Pyrobaculum aerophilum]